LASRASAAGLARSASLFRDALTHYRSHQHRGREETAAQGTNGRDIRAT
jgi:hypothetical protein